MQSAKNLTCIQSAIFLLQWVWIALLNKAWMKSLILKS